MNKYPKIIIPGKVLSKKNKWKPAYKRIYLGIDKEVLRTIILAMKSCWDGPVIDRPIQASILMYVTSYPPYADIDLDNAKQIYLDLMQEDKIKIRRKGRCKGMPYLASEGAGIIKDDKIVQSTDGSRFYYLCKECEYGLTGKRRELIRKVDGKKVKTGCQGATNCKQRRVEITITDMVLNGGVYENERDK